MISDKNLSCSLLENTTAPPIYNNNCSSWTDIPSGFLGDPTFTIIVFHKIFQLFHTGIFACGVCGNMLVIYVIFRHSRMKTVTNFYILNLALADMSFLLGLPFLIATSSNDYWVFGHFMCKLYMVSTSLNQFTSSLFLTIMSADRYIAVCHPINSPKYRTKVISKAISLTAWTIASLMSFPIFMYSSTIEMDGRDHCNIFWPNGSFIRGQVMFVIYSVTLSFIIPLCFIFLFYIQVVIKLKTLENNSKARGLKKPKKKVVKLVFTLIVVYAICYLPYWALQISLSFMAPRKIHTQFVMLLFLMSSCLSYINSAINPVLYAFFSDNFKKSFQRAFVCCAIQKNDNTLDNAAQRQSSNNHKNIPVSASDDRTS